MPHTGSPEPLPSKRHSYAMRRTIVISCLEGYKLAIRIKATICYKYNYLKNGTKLIFLWCFYFRCTCYLFDHCSKIDRLQCEFQFLFAHATNCLYFNDVCRIDRANPNLLQSGISLVLYLNVASSA